MKRMPFNLIAHGALVAAGFVLTQHDADYEDIGDGETGPWLVGGPAYDEYESPTHRTFVDHHGLPGPWEERDLEFEAWIDLQTRS